MICLVHTQFGETHITVVKQNLDELQTLIMCINVKIQSQSEEKKVN